MMLNSFKKTLFCVHQSWIENVYMKEKLLVHQIYVENYVMKEQNSYSPNIGC